MRGAAARPGAADTELVCGVNLELLRGVAAGAGDDADRAVLDPRPGRCCVRLLRKVSGGRSSVPP